MTKHQMIPLKAATLVSDYYISSTMTCGICADVYLYKHGTDAATQYTWSESDRSCSPEAGSSSENQPATATAPCSGPETDRDLAAAEAELSSIVQQLVRQQNLPSTLSLEEYICPADEFVQDPDSDITDFIVSSYKTLDSDDAEEECHYTHAEETSLTEAQVGIQRAIVFTEQLPTD
jgi:hypothetical protein